MKIIDFLFYFILCCIAATAISLHSFKSDIAFQTSTFESLESYEIYEQDAIELPHKDIQSLDIIRINDENYMISYLNKPQQQDSRLYGILFAPNKYSIQKPDTTWQNIAVNTRVWGSPKLLLHESDLKQQLKQYTYSFNSPIFQQSNDSLYLLINGQNFKKPITSRIHIFKTNLDSLFEYLQDTDTQKNIDTTPIHFESYNKIIYGLIGNLNTYLSNKILIAQDNADNHNFILPFYTKLNGYISLFGIFDYSFHLKEVIKPHNYSFLSQPLIEKITQDYSLHSNSHSCLALYNNQSQQKEKKLYFQTCEINNGVLSFSEMQESKTLFNIDSLSLATLGHHTILIYRNTQTFALHLAVWNGDDFVELLKIDGDKNNKISNPKILINGSYAYIAYIKDSHNTLYVLTINESFIKSLVQQD